MSATPPPQDPSPSSQRKISRVLLALAVAASVFVLGNVFVSQLTHQVELPPAPALAGRAGASPTPSPSQPDAGSVFDGNTAVTDASRDAGAATDGQSIRDAALVRDAKAEAADQAREGGGPAHAHAKVTTTAPAGENGTPARTDDVAEDVPAEGSAGSRGGSASGDCGLPEKEIAREAWRKNVPTICLGGSGKNQKASLYLPVKGAVTDATYDYRRKQRLVRITAPSAGSQLTMPQYKLRRHGFHDLKIAPEASGSKFRLSLEKGSLDPVVELRESFIRVVLAVPGADAE